MKNALLPSVLHNLADVSVKMGHPHKELAPLMNVQDFLRQIPELLRSQLPQELREFQAVGPVGSLMKFHYGEPSIHYEVWVQRRVSLVEVGLHFEGNADANDRYLEGLSAHFVEIRAALGPDVEAEQWTRSWTRIHQSVPLSPLEEDFLLEVSSQLARMITVLQPMVQEVSLAASR